MSPGTSPENEVIFRMELPLEEDLVAELEQFVYLGRLGVVGEALQILDEILWQHLRHFPVLAEAAAFLIEHGKWNKLKMLVDELHRRDITYTSADETQFVEMLRLFLKHKAYEPNTDSGGLDTALTQFDAEDIEYAYASPAKASLHPYLVHIVTTNRCRCKR